MSKKLCLFTTEFPFGLKTETFLESEMQIMSGYFDEIYIFPTYFNDRHERPTPSNVHVIRIDQSGWVKNKNSILLKNFFLIVSILFKELFYNSNNRKTVADIRQEMNVLVHKIYVSEQLKKNIFKNKLETAVYYSYWLTDWAIVLGVLKRKKIIEKFISRAHGFDIYESRRADNRIPFRYFHLEMVDKVYSVSKKGRDYLIAKGLFKEKIDFSYLGVDDRGVNPFDSSVFRIVSCSNLMPLKRVHLIIEILMHLDFPIEWIHFGDGDPEFSNQIREKALQLPTNVKSVFMGHVPNDTVLNYYKSNSINLFILLSESEGLPMSLIEAASFGIPLIATDVGGVSEIVNEKTGILIEKEVDPVSVSLKIKNFRNSTMNQFTFRDGVRKFWLKNFLSTKNYYDFYSEIEKKLPQRSINKLYETIL